MYISIIGTSHWSPHITISEIFNGMWTFCPLLRKEEPFKLGLMCLTVTESLWSSPFSTQQLRWWLRILRNSPCPNKTAGDCPLFCCTASSSRHRSSWNIFTEVASRKSWNKTGSPGKYVFRSFVFQISAASQEREHLASFVGWVVLREETVGFQCTIQST